jgi:Sulfotransferase family
MIVSHAHRFIFLKTKKTAGTSTELALSACCGADDIIPPLRKHEALRRGAGPRNWQRTGPSRIWRQLVDVKLLGKRPDRIDYHPHMSASDLRAAIGKACWNAYFKFVVERNPWDRQVSYWQFSRAKMNAPDMSLRDSLALPRSRLKNPKYYMIDDELVVDHVIRYEHLDADLAAVMAHLGLGSALELPRANGAFRKSGDYRTHFDDETRDWVAEAYKTEIALFGYRFETPDPLLLDGRIKADRAAGSATARPAGPIATVAPPTADRPRPSAPPSPDRRAAS